MVDHLFLKVEADDVGATSLRKAKSFHNLTRKNDEGANKTENKKAGTGQLAKAKSTANLRSTGKDPAPMPPRRSARLQARQEKRIDDLIGQAVAAAVHKESVDKENTPSKAARVIATTSADFREPLSAREDPSQTQAQPQAGDADTEEAVPKKRTRGGSKPKAEAKTMAKKRGAEPGASKDSGKAGTSKRARVANDRLDAVQPAKPKRGRPRK